MDVQYVNFSKISQMCIFPGSVSYGINTKYFCNNNIDAIALKIPPKIYFFCRNMYIRKFNFISNRRLTANVPIVKIYLRLFMSNSLLSINFINFLVTHVIF